MGTVGNGISTRGPWAQRLARVRKEEREVVGLAQGSCRRNESGAEGGESEGILLGSKVQFTKEPLSLFR